MEYVDKSEAEKLVRIIQDRLNPSAASEAVVIRDKWLFENDHELLGMTSEVRKLLELADAVQDGSK